MSRPRRAQPHPSLPRAPPTTISLPGAAPLLQAERREKVVAEEEGCMLYQLVRNSDGEYFGLELFRDK